MMKSKYSLLAIAGLGLLSLALPIRAATTYDIIVTLKPAGGGEVSGGGKYQGVTNAIATATPNPCYTFVDWIFMGNKQTSTNNPLFFTVSNEEVTVVANFQQIKYEIATSSVPTNGGKITGGGLLECGAPAKVTETPNTGFAFTGWISSLGLPTTNKEISFTVTNNENFVAHYKDIAPPTLAITAPANNEKIAASAFAIEGAAKDNVGVEAVYVSLNGGAWTQAQLVPDSSSWYAYVTLPPNSTNTVTAYAVDGSGNATTNKPVKFFCTAAGYAPMSISQELAVVSPGGVASNSFQVSFDSAVYVLVSDNANNGGEVGTYTYTPTGPNTAELVPHTVLPAQQQGTNNALELTFTDAYNASYSQGTNGSGTVQLFATEESVPASLDGATIIQTSVDTNFVTTNILSAATFTQSGADGSASGSYTFTQFTPVGALLVETSSSGGAADPTNYIVLSFNEGVTPPSGSYFSATLGSSGVPAIDAGTFTASTSANTNKLVGPASVTGLGVKVTPILPKGEKVYPFTRTFGRGTFASMFIPPGTNFFLFTNGPNDVGLHLSNLHETDNAGVATFIAVAPGYAVVLDDYSTDVLWKSATSATSSNLTTGEVASLAFAPLKNNAPASLSGMVITAHSAGSTKASTFTFSYNNVVGGGEAAGIIGTYTYAPYTPTMALLQLTATDIADAGQVQYVVLNFESPGGGAFVVSKFSGTWELRPGTFSIAK